MKIEKWKYDNVRDNGDCIDDDGNIIGNVHVNKIISMSPDSGGCGLKGCHCSDGHWLMIGFGLHDNQVSGLTVYFDNWGEMQLFLSTGKLID